LSLDSTHSGSNFRFGQHEVYDFVWKWAKEFSTNEEKAKLIANARILDLQEHENATVSPLSELRVSFPFFQKQKTRKAAVYVERSNNQEHIIYKSKQMKIGRLYPIIWEGKKIALRKTHDAVQILESVG